MAFQMSPGVLVTEKDLTSIVPAVSTSVGAAAGAFTWGPVMDPVTVSSENVLVQRFGKPEDGNAQDWFTAANFLSYTNNLLLVRTDTTNQRNAVTTQSGTVTDYLISNGGSGYSSNTTVTFGLPQVSGGVRATGTPVINATTGEITAITLTNPGSGYTSAPSISVNDTGSTDFAATVSIFGGAVTGLAISNGGKFYSGATITFAAPDTPGTTATADLIIVGGVITGINNLVGGSGYTTPPTFTISDVGGSGFSATSEITVGGIKINNETDYLTNYVNGAGLVGEWAAKYPGALGNSLKVSIADTASYAAWAYKAEFDSAPGTSSYAAGVGGSNDELHIVVIDEDGSWTGTQGSILEKFAYVSKASDAKKSDGSIAYYRDVVNSQSKYIWWMDHTASGTNWGTTAAGKVFTTIGAAVTVSLSGGVDHLVSTDGQKMNAFALFANDELYDVSLIACGKASSTVAEFVINNVAEVRKDCVAFVSPQDIATGDIIIGNESEQIDDLIAYRNELPSTSYAVLDSGFKYQYDRYNDKYRWVPLNADIAGLCARTDYTNDPWWSPGGLNRGQVKNVVKLAVNPGKTMRDNLYKSGVNPVVSFPGQGTVLFGDKTLLAKPSAFDRINVRRLFIVLEKAIATASKFQLFEFNDSFTRAQFKNMVEPFLRDVQGRRGIIDFRVKCDDTNNTGEVIDRNEFVADIYIKPNRSINFISLNFIAARTAVSFDEIGG